MTKMIAAVCLLAMSLSASAQTAPPAPPAPIAPVPPIPPIPPVPMMAQFGAGDDVMMFVSSEFGARSVIKGAPYAATAINETRQVLQDGNRIERSASMKLYRDGQGRTRQEQPGGVVFINDVVAGKRYILNDQRRSARELRVSPMHVPPAAPTPPTPPVGAAGTPPRPPAPPDAMTADEARSWAEEMRRWGRELAERMRGEHNVIVNRRSGADDQSQMAEHIEVIRLHDGNADARAMTPPFPPLPPMSLSPPPGPGATTALGNRDFGGVSAQGTKTTWTIEAGRIGNKLPIEIVSERWFSPELNVVMLSRHADPRSGERIYRLENITRAEPNADLFKVPADYTLKSAPAPRERDRERERK